MGRFSRAERRPPPGALSWASHPPQSPAATGGARAAVPETSAALVSGQRRAASPSPPALLSASAGPSVRHPPPHRPWPRPRGAARTGGRDKVAPGLSPAAICSPQPRLLHRWWGRRRGEPGERYFSMGLPGHCGEGRAAGLARALRTQTSAPRPRGSVAPGRGVPAPQVGGERRPSRLSVRPSARPLAARAPGARPRTLTRAAHSRVAGPTSVPRKLRALAPGSGPTPGSSRHHQHASHPHRGSGSSPDRSPGGTEAAQPAIAEAGAARPGASRRCAHTARPAGTRGEEEGAAPCLRLARWLADWGTHTPARTPPIPAATSAAQKVAGGVALPVQPTARPGFRRLLSGPRPQTPEPRAGEARGCGAEVWAEAASRASRVPAALLPRSAPATARRSPASSPASARLPASSRRLRRRGREAQSPPPAPGSHARLARGGWGRRWGRRREIAEPEAVAGTRGGGVRPHRSRIKAARAARGAAARRPGEADRSRRAVC